jgi:L-fucose dehydrogenase
MDLELRDKVVLVTGGASGIGAAIVRTAVQEGAIVAIADRNAELAHTLARELNADGARIAVVIADLCQPEHCERTVRETSDKFGRIDALVNNAGVNDRVGLQHGAPQEFVASLQRNLLHYYNMAHYALPALKQPMDRL